MGASGTIGKLMTFSTWKGIPYVRRRVIPKNPKTSAQIGMRSAMQWGSQEWGQLASAVQDTWAALAATGTMSNFNAFIKAGQGNARNNLGYQQSYPNVPADDPVNTADFAASAVERQVHLTWTDGVEAANFGMIIYRSTTMGFTPSPQNMIKWVDMGVEEYFDNPGAAGTYYYSCKTFATDAKLSAAATEVNATTT